VWLDAGLNIAGNPKGHLTFDGHLYQQVHDHGGLADKIEDWVKLMHQVWKQQKKVTWQIPNFEKQQMVQINNICVHENPIVQKKMQEVDDLRK
jgi:hypothetical protein